MARSFESLRDYRTQMRRIEVVLVPGERWPLWTCVSGNDVVGLHLLCIGLLCVVFNAIT